MRFILTIILLIAIPITYYFVTGILDNKVVEKKQYNVDFTEAGSGIKKLDALDSYNSISEKPLFSESREQVKKIIKKKKEPSKPVVQNLTVKALGIALTGEGVLAVLKDLKSGKIIRLRIKDKIYGWTLEGVSEDNFNFSKDGQRKIINFKK